MIRQYLPRSVKDVVLRRFHPLTSIAVELTNRCNEDCSYCHRRMRPLGDMSIPTYLKVLNQIPRGALLSLSYGGESIIHPKFPYMLEITLKHGFKPIVFSNGKEPYPKGVKVIVYPKPPAVIFTHDQRFEDLRAVENLKPVNTYCRDLFRYAGILWNGDVVPCCSDIAGIRVVGNVLEQPLKTIWEGEKYQELRKRGYCEGCEIFRYDWRVLVEEAVRKSKEVKNDV